MTNPYDPKQCQWPWGCDELWTIRGKERFAGGRINLCQEHFDLMEVYEVEDDADDDAEDD